MNEGSYFDKIKKKASTRATEQIRATNRNTTNTNGVQEPKEAQVENVTEPHSYHCQTGILSPFEVNEHALYIIFHLTNEHDTDVRKACGKLPQLKESLLQQYPSNRIEVVLGIGYSKTREWLALANIPFPKSFKEFKVKQGPTGKSMPYTGGHLLLHIRSNRKDLCFELGQRFYQLIPDDCIVKLDETFGFSYMGSSSNGLSRDLTGFEDGNDNPKSEDSRAKAALIFDREEAHVHVGGSFALTQKWKHDLIKWNQLPKVDQENVIGRTKGEDSKKIRPKVPTSHVARTDLKENGVDIKVVRQSLPYGGMKEHGLFFISYASSTDKHEKQLNSMVGMGDGVYDRIMDFSTPITGNYWFIPSTRVYRRLFNF